MSSTSPVFNSPAAFGLVMDHAPPTSPDQPESTAGACGAETGCADGGGSLGFGHVPRLTAALKTGEEAAFTWLHRHWSGRINRYCFALAAGDAALCGEIAQAVWLRVVRHMRLLADEAALWSWLACAARHAASDLRRKGGRYRAALNRFTEWWAGRGDDAFSHDMVEPDAEARLLAALEAALARLDSGELALIEGRYFSGDSLEAIGARVGLSARAVEGRLARLRARLRDLVAEELKADPSC